MAARPVYDPQIIARSRILSTHATPHVRNRRYESAKAFTETWLKLESSVASARSSLGPMTQQLELGCLGITGWAPDGYEPMDDLVECREVLRYCITQSCGADEAEMHMARPRTYWQAWWHHRVERMSEASTCSELNALVKCGTLAGPYVKSGAGVEHMCKRVDAVLENELWERGALITNAIREAE